jgi:hypothetical protein
MTETPEHNCMESSRVTDSRDMPAGWLLRRRECKVCRRRFSTVEVEVAPGFTETKPAVFAKLVQNIACKHFDVLQQLSDLQTRTAQMLDTLLGDVKP